MAKEYTENILRSMINTLIVSTNDGTIEHANKSACDLLGYTENELIGMPVKNVFVNNIIPEKFHPNELEKKGSVVDEETTYIRKNNGEVPVSLSGSIIKNEDGGIKGTILIAQDIARRKKAEENLKKLNESLEDKIIERTQELKQSKEYAENLIQSSLDMIIAVDLAFNITEFNLAAQKMFGYSKEDVIGHPVESLYFDPHQCSEVYKTILKEKKFTGEITNKKKNGDTFPAFMSASLFYDANSNLIGIMTVSRDIVDQKALEEKLKHDATDDTLTNLSNRILFIDRLELAIARSKRNKQLTFAVLFLDLDRFKLINDSLGHAVGDKLLISVSE